MPQRSFSQCTIPSQNAHTRTSSKVANAQPATGHSAKATSQNSSSQTTMEQTFQRRACRTCFQRKAVAEICNFPMYAKVSFVKLMYQSKVRSSYSSNFSWNLIDRGERTCLRQGHTSHWRQKTHISSRRSRHSGCSTNRQSTIYKISWKQRRVPWRSWTRCLANSKNIMLVGVLEVELVAVVVSHIRIWPRTLLRQAFPVAAVTQNRPLGGWWHRGKPTRKPNKMPWMVEVGHLWATWTIWAAINPQEQIFVHSQVTAVAGVLCPPRRMCQGLEIYQLTRATILLEEPIRIWISDDGAIHQQPLPHPICLRIQHLLLTKDPTCETCFKGRDKQMTKIRQIPLALHLRYKSSSWRKRSFRVVAEPKKYAHMDLLLLGQDVLWANNLLGKKTENCNLYMI